MQVNPSPWCPSLQTHTKDPFELVHTALSPQGDCSTHSSISERIHSLYIRYFTVCEAVLQVLVQVLAQKKVYTQGWHVHVSINIKH